MYIATEEDEVFGNNKNASVDFELKSSAKAFKILSNNLYKNKIRAIVRELSTNCLDAHKLNGNTRPFEILRPTWIDQKFVIRDFGPGLSPEGIRTLLCTYFASSKDQSNEFIGALGLGAKSPFSYTDSFIVTSFFEGNEYVFNASMINSKPTISLIKERPSDKPTGLEIKVPVKSTDVDRWEDEIEYVLFSFPDNSFKVTNGLSSGQNIPSINNKDLEKYGYSIRPNVNDRHHMHSNDIWAVYGNIVYPLSSCPGAREASTWMLHLERPVYIKFALGELDITPSREELSFDDTTVSNIISRLKELNSKMMEETIVQISEEYVENKRKGIAEICKYPPRVISALRKDSRIDDILKYGEKLISEFGKVCDELNTTDDKKKPNVKIYNNTGQNVKPSAHYSYRASIFNMKDLTGPQFKIDYSKVIFVIEDHKKTLPKIIKNADNLGTLFDNKIGHGVFVILVKPDCPWYEKVKNLQEHEFAEYSLSELYDNADFTTYEAGKTTEKRPKSPNVIECKVSDDGVLERKGLCMTASEVRELEGHYIASYSGDVVYLKDDLLKDSSLTNTDKISKYGSYISVSNNAFTNAASPVNKVFYEIKPNAWKYIDTDNMRQIVDVINETANEVFNRKTATQVDPLIIINRRSDDSIYTNLMKKIVSSSGHKNDSEDIYFLNLSNSGEAMSFLIHDDKVSDYFTSSYAAIQKDYNKSFDEKIKSNPLLAYLINNWYSIRYFKDLESDLLKLIK